MQFRLGSHALPIDPSYPVICKLVRFGPRGTLCCGTPLPEFKKMKALQLAFCYQLCKLGRSVSACDFCRACRGAWMHVWWSRVLSFIHGLAKMPKNSLHADIRDNTQDTEHSPLVFNWAGGAKKQYANLGMASHVQVVLLGRLMSRIVKEQYFPKKCLSGRAFTCRPQLPFQAVHLHPLVCLA